MVLIQEKLTNATVFFCADNSRKTHTLTFQLSLVHYSKEIIDSVIYHELAHDFYFDHSANFYKLLLSYCPNYFKLKAKLRKGIVQ